MGDHQIQNFALQKFALQIQNWMNVLLFVQKKNKFQKKSLPL